MLDEKQGIVDEMEGEGFYLVDQLGNELYFGTNTGEADDEYLDLAYEIASMYAAVEVYDAYHEGEECVVVELI